MILDHDVWVDATLTVLAPPHSEGSFLLARKGSFMHDDRARALGVHSAGSILSEQVVSQPSITAKPMNDSTTKQTKKPRNKAIHSSENRMILPSEDKAFESDGYEEDEETITLEPFDDLE